MNGQIPSGSTNNAMIYDPVPRFSDQLSLDAPKPTAASPAILSYIIRTHETAQDGHPTDTLYFYIGRDRSIKLRSFTISYRISALPIMVDDPNNPFYTYEYTDADIDDHEFLLCSFTLPPAIANAFPGCSAYVSKICPADSEDCITFAPGDFVYSAEDAEKVQAAMNAAYGEETLNVASPAAAQSKPSQPADDDFQDTLEIARMAQKKQQKKRATGTRLFGYALVAVGLFSLFSIGKHYLAYQSAMLGAAVYIDAGEQLQAEQYIKEEIGDNLFLNSQKSTISRVALQLCTEERYNEAYRIISETPFASIQQSICREASEKALEAGDWETAYLYALGAPTPFDAEITAAATELLLDPYTDTFNEDAFRVAQRTSDTAALDHLLTSIVRYACAENHYHVAMRAAKKITDPETASKTVADVFGIATQYYIGKNAFQEAAVFIQSYRTDDSTIDADIEQALIDHFSSSKDADSAFFLAKQFGIDASHIPISPEDSAVRADLENLYPLLTFSQKQSYHANSVTCGGLLLTKSIDGVVTLKLRPSSLAASTSTTADPTTYAQKRINAFLTDKPAISAIESSHTMTAFVHTDGTVTVLSNRVIGNASIAITKEESYMMTEASNLKNVVAVEAGDEHFVFLHADGTVSCLGDNTYRQCDTKTSEWHDIAAIAAGSGFTVGLRTDGTVVACGSDSAGQCQVQDLHNVVDVEACDRTTVVLFADGSVGIRGERSGGIADVLSLENVVRIRAGSSAIITEHRDGTYTLCGGCAETGDFGSVASWKSVTDYDIGNVCAAALEENGTLRTTGSNRAKQ